MGALWCLFILALCLNSSRGHGSLNEPPSRASAWRHGFDTKPDYDDDGCNCGGFGQQWDVNGGKCGVCGDPWNENEPRAHELGGEYGTGVIVRYYKAGSTFPVTVNLTTCHKGFWELRLCADAGDNTEECFEYILERTNGESKFYPVESRVYELKYRLPVGVACEHCVLAWWYTAGNNWGDCGNGTSALGCGRQENFRACADITIRTVPGKKFLYYRGVNKNMSGGKDAESDISTIDQSDYLENLKEEATANIEENIGEESGKILAAGAEIEYQPSEYFDGSAAP